MWVPYTIKKRNVIIPAIKSCLDFATHKYGVEIPSSIEHAIFLDSINWNRLWQESLEKDMQNLSVAFEILPNGVPVPFYWENSSKHVIWDVKMDFTRKARWVKDDHLTPDLKESNYAGVFSRYSVRIAFTYSALNDMDVTSADIQKSYLQAPSSEKHYVICGKEFGLKHEGKVDLVRHALYGGKLAGRYFMTHLRICMTFLGFKSYQADPDIWMKEATKTGRTDYW